ncbi:MAG: redoxin domain-containing protein [Bacteroidota bacterium]
MNKKFHLLIQIMLLTMTAFAQQQKGNISVYVFLLEDCVISQHYAPVLNELHEKYANDSLQFIGVFPNRFSSPKTIEQFKTTYDIAFDLKYDYYQSTARRFDAEVTPEVVVYDENAKLLLYKGRIDNQFVRVGRRRQVLTSNELADVLAALREKKPIEITSTDAVGCFIKYEKSE